MSLTRLSLKQSKRGGPSMSPRRTIPCAYIQHLAFHISFAAERAHVKSTSMPLSAGERLKNRHKTLCESTTYLRSRLFGILRKIAKHIRGRPSLPEFPELLDLCQEFSPNICKHLLFNHSARYQPWWISDGLLVNYRCCSLDQ